MNLHAPPRFTTEIAPPTEEGIAKAKDLLLSGQLVAVPTETVYGLAGLSEQDQTLRHIFETKGRPQTNPLIIHVHKKIRSLDDLSDSGIINQKLMSQDAFSVANQLIQLYWPGPLTLILPKGRAISSVATAGGETVAVRQSSHPIFQKLLISLDKPLAAPSANRTNRISPTSAQDVFDELGGKIPLIIDGGTCAVGLESTVIQVDANGSLIELRSGGLPTDVLLRQGFRFSKSILKSPPSENHPLLAPGQLPIHYSPEKPLLLIFPPEITPQNLKSLIEKKLSISITSKPKIATIRFHSEMVEWWEKTHSLMPQWTWINFDASILNDPLVAAKELFSLMRAADRSDADLILVERPLSKASLWPAVLDRLSRASRQ